ncbi:NADH:ubiquinone oxidoreductase subunit [Maritimibacter alkaliphilus HTCC2654]|uniref:NADH-ubiquinone oxidoreductase n=1 Tax=Maritimibacter alkaliphilus HTCC2654 TaxID=314271 RepID=A3VIP5_9RHOB|nr:NADH:ubiquinone oxidoreductase subunit NDUFA12 [Maritimibacter alkaliphilus]EAQ11976.1 NADH-ubiquinone oxidoreductase [Rhodobacterales bacterium HTCC2654] [Maritimibacter alkaliphilus HTCC2654]TYP85605.1 NADH:ubiquinone oxidoreductase subunit [Maritimibacter alkaliphilus HTCC2654]
MRFILSLLTWWHEETLGTRLYTWRKGVKVGEDAQGNEFYRNKDDSKRWVCYAGEPEASRISADWHGWLHRTFDDNPANSPLAHKDWEKPHVDNMTGTALAYVPAGSIRREKPVERSDYEAWQPE